VNTFEQGKRLHLGFETPSYREEICLVGQMDLVLEFFQSKRDNKQVGVVEVKL
jgi:hypothetical protein